MQYRRSRMERLCPSPLAVRSSMEITLPTVVDAGNNGVNAAVHVSFPYLIVCPKTGRVRDFPVESHAKKTTPADSCPLRFGDAVLLVGTTRPLLARLFTPELHASLSRDLLSERHDYRIRRTKTERPRQFPHARRGIVGDGHRHARQAYGRNAAGQPQRRRSASHRETLHGSGTPPAPPSRRRPLEKHARPRRRRN